MKYEPLGRSGIRVSRLCLGTMMFGGRTSEEESVAIIDDAFAQGVNFIDTADVYNEGRSEEVVGRAIRSRRDQWVLATKVGNRFGPGDLTQGLSRRWVLQACENSLNRLGTDRIDLYYLHLEDHTVAMEETVRAVEQLIRSGKIVDWGLSNYRGWRVAEMCRLADEAGIQRPIALQPYYNAFNRMPEVELLPCAQHYGIGVVPYSPIARGVLTGKYRPGEAPPEGSRAGAQDVRMMETEWREESLILAQTVKGHAEARGVTSVQFAAAWVLANRHVTSCIAGPRTLDQWRDYVGAVDFDFTADDEAFVDTLVAPGHPSTPGYTDPRYPLEGRVLR
ncbi:aldo/keto reductase [Stappia sp. F7233]|uniref:Aldo/keto reductase n=1 Tax=Stappia albiluteola TaxID=2758565 RepID=A0A839AGH6_9HYPH|nr:aldo/keto reductase [Stappia albiluteola]MBA5777857.1 aldo/keto reductase [Stappia albiluteola]